MIFGLLILSVALMISGTAAYYSILGLTAIFAGAFWPVVLMGSVLEIGKIMATVWLHRYWQRCPFFPKMYLSIAVITIMFVTSMGVFGFLSKSHIEQSTFSGDNTLKIELIDNKINRQQRRVDDSNTVLNQLDDAVNVLIQFDRIRGPNGSIATREKQKEERAQLSLIIDQASDAIGVLQEEKGVFQQDQIQLEAEVGPIRYVAEIIYGDTSRDLLEKAVRWVIILLVAVFDPFAIMLILAASMTFKWNREDKEKLSEARLTTDVDDALLINEEIKKKEEKIKELEMEIEEFRKIVAGARATIDQTPTEVQVEVENTERIEELQKQLSAMEAEHLTMEQSIKEMQHERRRLLMEVSSRDKAVQSLNEKYNLVDKVNLGLVEDVPGGGGDAATGFGLEFPPAAKKGDMFLRVDLMPSRLFTFNDTWNQIDKEEVSIDYDDGYLNDLLVKLDKNEISLDDLSSGEQAKLVEILSKEDVLGK